jgi:hypothetical protein
MQTNVSVTKRPSLDGTHLGASSGTVTVAGCGSSSPLKQSRTATITFFRVFTGISIVSGGVLGPIL